MSLNNGVTVGIGLGLALVGISTHSLASPGVEPVPGHVDGTVYSANGNAEAVAPPAAAGTEQHFKPDFSGDWALNAKVSDDPLEKAKEAMQASKHARGGGRGAGRGGGLGGGMGGGMQDGRRGREAAGGMGGGGGLSSRELAALVTPSQELHITHEDPMLLIIDEHGRRQHLFTDFRGASVSASGSLQQRVAVAGWEDGVLVVEATMIGNRLIQGYQIDAGSRQLIISSVAHLSESQSVSYRLVYDRLKPAAGCGESSGNEDDANECDDSGTSP